jgi:hypothetical protein
LVCSPSRAPNPSLPSPESNTNIYSPVRLQSGSLAIFSPVALTPTVKSKLQSLSPNPPHTYLIAPDMEHHIFLSPWYSHFSSSHVIAPEGLAEKRATQNKTDKSVTIIPFSTIFTAKNKSEIKISEEFDKEFEYEYLPSHPNKELVFHHLPSKTLIEADLLFNLPATEQYSKTGIDPTTGWATRLFAALNNTKGDAKWQKRLLWYGISSSDRKGFNESVKRIGGWGFETIVPAHGDVIPASEGKGIFEKVFEWHLKAKD